MRKMIWIPDELVEEIKEAAYGEKRSFSAYLVGLHRERVGAIDGEGVVPAVKVSNAPDFISYSKESQLGKK